eukprot:comp22527_c0_seq1/m.56691 comp22527_c0_seq1/g.56691  ORF comp22527_c0_seq1/g.56691 comp22527_c0_seq1/m.56691 type:complete len:724 (-) comp22527_c0_seq1:4397-6568(-)
MGHCDRNHMHGPHCDRRLVSGVLLVQQSRFLPDKHQLLPLHTGNRGLCVPDILLAQRRNQHHHHGNGFHPVGPHPVPLRHMDRHVRHMALFHKGRMQLALSRRRTGHRRALADCRHPHRGQQRCGFHPRHPRGICLQDHRRDSSDPQRHSAHKGLWNHHHGGRNQLYLRDPGARILHVCNSHQARRLHIHLRHIDRMPRVQRRPQRGRCHSRGQDGRQRHHLRCDHRLLRMPHGQVLPRCNHRARLHGGTLLPRHKQLCAHPLPAWILPAAHGPVGVPAMSRLKVLRQLRHVHRQAVRSGHLLSRHGTCHAAPVPRGLHLHWCKQRRKQPRGLPAGQVLPLWRALLGHRSRQLCDRTGLPDLVQMSGRREMAPGTGLLPHGLLLCLWPAAAPVSLGLVLPRHRKHRLQALPARILQPDFNPGCMSAVPDRLVLPKLRVRHARMCDDWKCSGQLHIEPNLRPHLHAPMHGRLGLRRHQTRSRLGSLQGRILLRGGHKDLFFRRCSSLAKDGAVPTRHMLLPRCREPVHRRARSHHTNTLPARNILSRRHRLLCCPSVSSRILLPRRLRGPHNRPARIICTDRASCAGLALSRRHIQLQTGADSVRSVPRGLRMPHARPRISFDLQGRLVPQCDRDLVQSLSAGHNRADRQEPHHVGVGAGLQCCHGPQGASCARQGRSLLSVHPHDRWTRHRAGEQSHHGPRLGLLFPRAGRNCGKLHRVCGRL